MRPVDDSQHPTLMGRYRLIRRIAVGGMAEIFLARAAAIEGFEKAVVVKRILPQYAGDGELVRMFLDEARLAATLNHVNIAQVYDFGREGAWHFYTMEYVHGVDLGQLWKAAAARGGAMPLEHALVIVAGVAAGLHHAHEQRDEHDVPLAIVHRDVTPSNVLVGYDGSVKLADFGIARARDRRDQTAPGALRGKLPYMSPEQVARRPLDRRSDLFSLGVILHELTTGTRLFDEATDLDLLHVRLAGEVPALPERRPGYPRELAAIVERCLARAPADRYQTARAVQEALEGFARAQSLTLSPLRLGDYLAELFADEVARWRDAERAGTLLVDLVAPATEPHTVEVPAAPSAPVRAEAPPPRRISRRVLAMSAAAIVAVAGVAVYLAALRPSPPSQTRTVWAGAWHSCALDGDGRVSCWGKNNEGQLGIGKTIDQQTRAEVPGLRHPVAFSGGFFHGCACARDGQAHCWGRNDEGQLGTGDTTPATTPVPVAGLRDCVQISAGMYHTCAVRRSGAIVCWGRNDRGQTGHAPGGAVLRPTAVGGIERAVQVEASGQLFPEEGGHFTCAVVADGRVLCFGDNGSGQLGDGGAAGGATPRAVRGLTDAREIALGGGFACARRATGQLACWGRSSAGPLQADAAKTAGALAAVGDAVAITAGLGHACAIRRSGELWCWGYNNWGQLGDGTRRDRAEPARVPGLERVTAVDAGDVHTCARHAAGVACWGANQTGQLGDGTSKEKPNPVSVAGFVR